MASPIQENPQNPYVSSVVRASAGSGKTYQLSRRFLFLVGAGASPSTILTVTFTKKAAAEMRARILDLAAKLLASFEERTQFEDQLALFYASRTNHNAPKPLSALETASRILASTQSLKISTIDSILLEWLKKFPFEASGEGALLIPPRFDLMSAYAEEKNHKRAWYRTLKSMLEAGDSALNAVLKNPEDLHLIDLENRLKELARHDSFLWLLKQERPHLVKQLVDHPIDEDWGDGHEKSLLDAIRPSLLSLSQILNKDRQAELGMALGTENLDALREARFLTAAGQVHGGTFRSPKKDPYSLEIIDINRLSLSFRSFLLKRNLNATGTILMQLFQDYQAASGQLKLEEGHLSFADLIKGGFHLFSHDQAAGARYLLNRSIRHLLLDEFQDTSVLQWTVFKSMAEEMLSGEGYRSVDELDPTLFIVGDAKQSIYGFREADAEILDTAADFMLQRSATNIELSASYRTHPLLLNFVNRIMHAVMPDFPTHEAAKDSSGQGLIKGDASIVISPLFRTDEGSGKPIEEEADYIAETLHARLTQGFKVYDKTRDGYRPLRAADCAILYRASTHARTYAAALRARGISVRIEEGQSFFTRPEISDLMALVRLMAYPNDIQAAFQVLKSPLVGVRESQLLRALKDHRVLVESDASLRHADPVAPLLDVLGQDAKLLTETFAKRHEKRPYLCLQEFAERANWLSIYRVAFDQEEGSLAAANIQKFMELVLQSDNSAQLSWMQVLRLLRDKEKEEAISLASVSEDSVQLMTIHKAKGLEWPLVVVTGTGEEWEKSDLYWAKLKDSAMGTGVAYIGRRGDLPDEDPHFHYLAKSLNAEALRENYRLLYVALTRAQFGLIITGFQRRAKDDDGSSYFHGLLRGAGHELEFLEDETSHALYQRKTDDLLDEKPSVRAPVEGLSPLDLWRSSNPIDGTDGIRILAPARLLGDKEVPSSGSMALPFAAEAGTYIHKALESSIKGADFGGLEYWQTLRRHHPREPFAKAWPLIDGERAKILQSKTWQRLKAEAIHFESELPIAYLKDAMLVRGIIDLVLKQADKRWLIVDYKTTWESLQGGDLLALCYKKRYDQQLQLYKEGVQRLYPDSEIRCAIFFTAQEQLVYLP
ncbi:MAG: UvrD-helicase domain-containing protein [Chitinophagaceae bacterium]|nr:UvrD-helicase domain-containing protein [Oligoflexus sp.]